MELLALLSTMAGAALGLVIVGTVLAVLGWRSTESEPLLFTALLRRQGDDVAARAFEWSTHELGVALQRCSACHEAAQCRAWLASGARAGYASFCPNADFIARLSNAP